MNQFVFLGILILVMSPFLVFCMYMALLPWTRPEVYEEYERSFRPWAFNNEGERL